MREAQAQTTIIKALKARRPDPPLVFNVHGHAMQQSGWPDLHIVHREWTGWMELKMRSAKLRASQEKICKALVARGVPVVVGRVWGEEVETLELTFEDGRLVESRLGLCKMREMDVFMLA